MKKVLILFSRKHRQVEDYRRIFDKLYTVGLKRNAELFLGNNDELWIEIKDNQLKITEPNSGLDLRDFDFVHFDWWGRAREQAYAAAHYLDNSNVPYLTKNLGVLSTEGEKICEMAALADRGINLPNTFISSHDQLKFIFKKNPPFKFPIVVKATNGYGGKNNFLADNCEDLDRILDDHEDIDFVVQEFIPNDCDYRCLIFDNKIKLVLKRTRTKNSNSHLNNTSTGADGQIVPLKSIPRESRRMAISASKTLNRSQFGGTDLIFDKFTNKPYILEVNSTPEIEEGAEPDKKIDALFDYIESEIK